MVEEIQIKHIFTKSVIKIFTNQDNGAFGVVFWCDTTGWNSTPRDEKVYIELLQKRLGKCAKV